MKRQVQSPGVRKWFGDDWINMQDELFSVLEGFFGNYNQQFILSGCEVNGNDIGAGIIGLIDGNGFHICRFAGVQGTAWPVYCYPNKVVENREYLDLQAKPVTETWEVLTSDQDPGGYFQLKQDGTSARFFDVIQTATRRFVTDAEKTSYAGQASAAITTLRDGVTGTYDTLAKIATALALLAPKASPALSGTPTAPTAANGTNTQQLATTAFVQAAIAALLDSAPGALDTLNELAAALGDDPNFAATMTNALALKAPKADPAFTGVPTAPTANPGTNNTQIATTAFVAAAIASGSYTLTKAAVEAVLTGTINSHDHSGTYLESITKAMVEAVLTGVINTHSHSIQYAQVDNKLKTYANLANGNVDLSANGGGKITLGGNTAFAFSGFELNKTYLLIVTANGWTPSFADGSKHIPVEGSTELGTDGVFYITLTCIDATAGNEKLLTTIMKGA